MNCGDTILILPSCALQELHLENLAGLNAKVIEVVKKSNKIYGCWVELPCGYLGEKEWFIPYSSISQ